MLVCVVILWKWRETQEYFEVYPDMEERVIRMYEEVLDRQPSATELINSTRDIKSDTITWDGLRQRLMDSDEYERSIKLQSNTLSPELDKMLADSRLIREIAAIYRNVKGSDVPNHMILPLRDLYVVINYNPFTLAAILKDKKYDAFVEDVGRVRELDKAKLIEMYTSTFNQTEIAQRSVAISRSPEAASIAAATVTNNNPQAVAAAGRTDATVNNTTPSTTTAATTTASGPANTLSSQEQQALREVLQVLGVSPDGKIACPIDSTDSCMTPQAQKIQDNARRVFDIHGSARRIEQPHRGNMVLRPEFAWSVPQPQPPVCHSLGRNPNTQPTMMSNSKLLLGTPLDEAGDTQVGSIMPKFEYKEFVDVPVTTCQT
jgi:hypothetical protein